MAVPQEFPPDSSDLLSLIPGRRSRREQLLDDSDWNEVHFINTYAVFMGYLSMAIKGLGFLVLTWTTVVLLGGFVSMLHHNDFWVLTFITLVQTAGIFDVDMNEKLSYMKDAVYGLLRGVLWGVTDEPSNLLSFYARFLSACVLMLVQVVVLLTVLCPLAIIYMYGVIMSGILSLLRLLSLMHHIGPDYSGTDGESSNLAPAMYTLYFLALLQGVLFCYRFAMDLAGNRLAKRAASNNFFHSEVLYKYLCETRTGCEKDPSFAKGRNLITHAVDMIGSNSPLDCISGVKMLYTAIFIAEREQQDILSGRRMLMKHLVLSTASSKHILQKLLETLDSRGLHDRKTRNQAATIVEHLAFNINLEQFPGGIEHISSLIETYEQYSIAEPFERDCLYDKYEQDWKLHVTSQLPSRVGKLGKAYKRLLLQGLCILRKLAANKNNCRVMSNTRDLVSKIMVLVSSDLLDHTTDDHGAWSYIVEASMNVMIQLTGAPGEVGAKLCHEISSHKGAINTLWRILNCNKCNNDRLQLSAIRILKQLYMDTESNRLVDSVLEKENNNSSSKEDFVRMLVDIFTQDKKHISSIRGYTGGALSELCFCDGISCATVVIQIGGGDVVDSLTKVLVHDENESCRHAAAEILEYLCTYYTKDDEYHCKLKKAMTNVMPEVIREILSETHREKAHQDIIQQETDIENQCEDNCRGKGTSSSPSSHPQNNEKKVAGDILRCGDKTHNGKEVDRDGLTKLETDMENQRDNGHGKGTSSSSSSHLQNNEQDEEEKVFQAGRSVNLLSSLLSLCGTVYDTFIGELGPDVAPQFQAFFLNKLKAKSDPTVENLLLYKSIAKMVLSIMKHSGSRFAKLEDLKSLIEALSEASKTMMNLDNSMVLSSDITLYATRLSKLNKRTLVSLVKEAKELHAMVPSTSMSG